MKTAGKILVYIGLIIGSLLIAMAVAQWIWSWDIPEWMKVWLIST